MAELVCFLAGDDSRFVSDRELEAIAYMLMSARNYLFMRYAKSGMGAKKGVPDWVVPTYMKLVRHGIA